MRRDFLASNGCEAVSIAMETCPKTLDLQEHAVFLFYLLAHADDADRGLLAQPKDTLQRVRSCIKTAMLLHKYDTNIRGYGYHTVRAFMGVLPDEELERGYVTR